VARPTRIDRAAGPSRTLGRRPIVLARLPYVGARVESREPRVESQEVAPPARLPPPPSFEPKSRESRPIKTSPQQRQPTGLSATLFTLHSQLAPFAGAIVALALIASAGLLYWMMVNPGRMSTDFRDAAQEGFEASTARLPQFAPQLPSFASRTKETTAFEMPRWDFDEEMAESSSSPLETSLEETLALQLQEKELVVTLKPAAEPPTEPTPVNAPGQTVNIPEPTASPAEGPAFPTTNRPTALDFAKLRVKRL